MLHLSDLRPDPLLTTTISMSFWSLPKQGLFYCHFTFNVILVPNQSSSTILALSSIWFLTRTCLLFHIQRSTGLIIQHSHLTFKIFLFLHSRPVHKPSSLLTIPPSTTPWFNLKPDSLISAVTSALWVCHWICTVISSNIGAPRIWTQTPGSVFSIPFLTDLKPRYLFEWPHPCFSGLTLNQDLCNSYAMNASLVWVQAFANSSHINTSLSRYLNKIIFN